MRLRERFLRPADGTSIPARLTPLAVLLLLAAVALAARGRTFFNPVVGYDEQFYLLVGDRLLKGALPFVDIFDRKPIGLFLIYAFARLLGGAGFVQYKLVALVFVVLTGFGVQRIARRFATPFGAIAAALLSMLWLNFMEGEGGQSPVFYNLPMVIAAGLLLRAAREPRRLRRDGAWAMIAAGIAIQIKYSVLIEAFYFGVVLLWLGWRGGRGWGWLATSAVLWAGCALLPTVAAFGYYAAIGHGPSFIFANFVSVFAQGRNPLAEQMEDLGSIVAILSPLTLWLIFGRPWRGVPADERGPYRLLCGWLAAAVVALLIYFRFNSPHYAMPLVPPLAIAIAPALGVRGARRWVAAITCIAALIVGQVVLAQIENRKGSHEAAAALAAAAEPGKGCIFVYDGYPGLYMLAHSCLPSRWAFPGHLNMRDEASARAIGIDPNAETRRIMATHPKAVIDDFPRFEGGNPATRAIVEQALARDYRLALCVRTGAARYRLLYRLRDDPLPLPPPKDCPPLPL